MQTLYPHLTLLLGLLLLIASPAVYNRGHQVWLSWKQYQELGNKKQLLLAASHVLLQQKELLARLDARANRSTLPGPLAFAAYLDSCCREDEVKVITLPRESRVSGQGYDLALTHFGLQGGFKNLLRLLFRIEYADKLGSISYLRLEKQLLRKNRQQVEVLQAQVGISRFTSPHP